MPDLSETSGKDEGHANNGAAMQERKRGNRLGFAFFKVSLALFGLRGAYGLLYFVCLYYVLFDRDACNAAMSYVKRRFRDYGPVKRVFCAYKIFINQGKVLIDRHYLLSGGRRFDCEVCGYDRLKALLAGSDKGVILLTAHVGNWQVAMTSIESLGKVVYLLMRPEDNMAVREALNIDSDGGMVRIIPSDSFLGGVVDMVNALNKGHLVSIMGDRTYGRNSLETSFLGGKARFPYAAFSLSAATGCPVAVLLSAKTDTMRYFVDMSHIIEPPSKKGPGGKMDGIGERVREFSAILENFVERYPLQWFVFDDIWVNSQH